MNVLLLKTFTRVHSAAALVEIFCFKIVIFKHKMNLGALPMEYETSVIMARHLHCSKELSVPFSISATRFSATAANVSIKNGSKSRASVSWGREL